MKKLLPLTILLLTLGFSTQNSIAQENLVITAVFDGNLPGQLPKGIELYVINDIADMSLYAVGSANNGQGTDGPEFVFPEDSYPAGSYIYVASEETQFTNFFGFAPNYTAGAVNINGDDAIELFLNDAPVDVFGEIEYAEFDGSWSYNNGWAYRNDATGPDGTTFVPENWTFSGQGALTGVQTNAEATFPIPVGTYSPEEITAPVVSFATSAVAVGEADGVIDITVTLTNPDPDNPTSVEVALAGGTAVNGVDFEYDSPQIVTFPAGSSDPQTVPLEIIENEIEDGDRTIELTLQNADNNALLGFDELVITILDDDFTIPLYDIAELRENDADVVPVMLGELVEARGVVHGINMRPQGLQFTLIDPTDGIAVYRDSENLGYTVQEGDSVQVIGTVSFFNGLAQINAESVALIETDRPLYSPAPVTELNEETESNMVVLECVSIVDSTQWNASGSGFNVEVTDGMNSYQVRIASPVTDLYTAPAPTGILNISGIGGQFDNSTPYNTGYQLLPRYAADIVDASEECITSIEDPEKASFLVYPNPVTDVVNIAGDLDISDIRVVDLSGRTVFQQSANGLRTLQISTADLPSGLYLLEIYTSSGRVVKEIVKP